MRIALLVKKELILKLGLVLAGGGGKGGYEIGVWKYLQEIGLYDKITVISGTSVGGLNAALMATVSYDVAEKIWTEEIDDKILDTSSSKYKNFALFSRNGLRTIMDKYIDLSKIKTSKKKVYVTCYNIKTLEPEAYCLNDSALSEIKDLLCATSAIPIVFQQEILREKKYFDGGIGDNIPIKPLLQEHCTHALIINLEEGQIDFSGFDIKVVQISPSTNLGSLLTGTLDFSLENSMKRINLGYSDCRNISANYLLLKLLKEDGMTTEQEEKANKINEMNEVQVMKETLKILCINKDEVKKLSCNINVIDIHGHALMKDIAEFGGWKFQEHIIWHWIRIIDEMGTCRTWGAKEKLIPMCKNFLINELTGK